MKPAPFRYYLPRTIDEALELLATHGWDAKPLAGGQSLVPAMNFRLAQPAVLVDLNGLPNLAFVQPRDGKLRMGAMTRQRTLERSALVQERAPLLVEAMPYIAHPQIRNRGTVGGSLAHADPAAELPALAVALDARFHIRSQTRERWVDGDQFYRGLFTTDLAPDELLTEIELPPLAQGAGWAFDEIARQHGNYAIAGAAAIVRLDAAGRFAQAKLVYLSIGEGPVTAQQAQSALQGEVPSAETIRAAAMTSAHHDVDPVSDIHASAAFRRHLVGVLAKRVLTRAVRRAEQNAVQ